jgi:hypothetical protein
MSKCESCRKGYNGRNGNGYMPCGCKPRFKVDNTDLNNLLKKAIEAQPEFVERPPLMPIGQPRLGWKPKQFKYDNSDPYKKFNILLLFIFSICMIALGVVIGVKL